MTQPNTVASFNWISIAQLADEAQLKLTRVGRSGQYKTDCPFCGDMKQNLELNVDKDVFHCWACGVGGGVIRFYALLNNVSEFAAKETLFPARSGKPRFDHPALHLSREELKLIGFRPMPRYKPNHMTDKDWFMYRKRTLDWIWIAWRRYEAWKNGFELRMQKRLQQTQHAE